MKTLHQLALLASITLLSIQNTSAQSQAQEPLTENPSPDVAKTFEPFTQRVHIDCGARQFILINDQKKQKFEMTLIEQQTEVNYSLTDSAFTSLLWDQSRFSSINYLCAERGISLLIEGYQYIKKDTLSPISQKVFISNKGKAKVEPITSAHEDFLKLAMRSGLTVFTDSRTQNRSLNAQIHGPWQPIKIEINQTIECNERLFTISYLPFYRNLNFTANINAEVRRRDISNQILQKIFENRGFYSRATYACIKDGYALRFQGVMKTYANNVEPLTITLDQTSYGNTSNYTQIDELLVKEDTTPLRGEIEVTKSSWKTTRQQVEETRVIPTKLATKPSVNNK